MGLESHKLFTHWAESTRTTRPLACAQQDAQSVICTIAHSSFSAVPLAARVPRVPPPVLVPHVPASSEADWYPSSACSQLFLELVIHLSHLAHLGPGELTIEIVKIDCGLWRLSHILHGTSQASNLPVCESLCINSQLGSRSPVWVWKKYLFFLFWGIPDLLLPLAVHSLLYIYRPLQRADPAQVFCRVFFTSLFTLDSHSAKFIKSPHTLKMNPTHG